ncbi:MAG: DUF1906 domain-containing protein [Anaerolineales bacterium]
MHILFTKTHLGRLILSLAILASGFGLVPSAGAQTQDQVEILGFGLITASSGWVLLDQSLFWTSNAGETWNNISPSVPADATIKVVRFIDLETGWVLSTTLNPTGGSLFHLAQTNDGGATWTTRTLSLFEAGEIASYVEKVDMGWLDTQHGWIAVKQASGSNFSIGTLFTTSDSGETWARSTLPVADTISFSDPQHGWASGGPTGDQVFVTANAGETWQNISPKDTENAQVHVYAPRNGLLIATTAGTVNSLSVYRETPSGTWSLFDQAPLNIQPGLIGLSILDAQNFVATIPGTNSLVRMVNGQLETVTNQDGFSSSIVILDMFSKEIGWGKSVVSHCDSGSSQNSTSVSVTCASTTRLLHTDDGGITWQNMLLPSGTSDTSRISALSVTSQSTTMTTFSNGGNSQIYIGQGFDICEIPTLSQMETWAVSSPYKAINLYIGGSSRLCSNTALTASYLKQLTALGWKFIPTWVGPQAPCTSYLTRMSSNTTTAYNQGVAQADLAVDTLATLGLTLPDQTGSIAYYDIEYYGTDSACRAAVNSFMNGWVSQMHTRGNLAGVYGSPVCNTALSDFRSITNVPDAVWIAAWYYNIGDPRGTYDPTASVWDWLGSCMPNTAWSDHQRLRQYSGDHIETWGSLSLEIDNDILDGLVAMSYVPKPPPYVIPTAMPTRERPVMKSEVLTPISLTSQLGTTSGSLSSLSLLNQTGAEDTPAAYISFQTGDTGYSGYQSFLLPREAVVRTLSTVLLQINFKGPASSMQVYTWSIYNWKSNLWIEIGNTVGLETNQWQELVFRIRQPWRYVSSEREIRIQLQSNNADGDAKLDYEALHITYLSMPDRSNLIMPFAPSTLPQILSVPIATPRP